MHLSERLSHHVNVHKLGDETGTGFWGKKNSWKRSGVAPGAVWHLPSLPSSPLASPAGPMYSELFYPIVVLVLLFTNVPARHINFTALYKLDMFTTFRSAFGLHWEESMSMADALGPGVTSKVTTRITSHLAFMWLDEYKLLFNIKCTVVFHC